MTTEAINRSRPGAAPNDRDERARAAVKAFRQMQHGLTSYARAITGNPKVRVEVSAGPPRTDGQVIYYRPPIRLGDKTPHQRLLCDKRDPETGLLSCPACSTREEVLVNIYHEIAHIAFGTFAPTTPRQKEDALQRAVDEWGAEYGERIKARFRAAGDHEKTYLGLASIISPFLPHLLNSLEDARVDSSMFEARKGTKKMLMADTYSLMRDGVEREDGTRVNYAELELNAQVTLGLYLSAAGYPDWQPFFHPKIGTDIADSILQELLEGVRSAASIEQVYEATFPILARLREMGYLLMPDEQQPDPSDEEQDSAESAGDSSGESSDSDQPEAEGEGSSDPGSSSGADSSGGSEGDSPEAGGDQSDGSGEPDGDADGSSSDAGPDDRGASTDGSDESDSGGEPEDGGLSDSGDVSEEVPGDGSEELGEGDAPDSEARGGAGGPDEQPEVSDETSPGSDSGSSEDRSTEGQEDSTESPEGGPISGGDASERSDSSDSTESEGSGPSGENLGSEGAESEDQPSEAEDSSSSVEVAPQGNGQEASSQSEEAGGDASADQGSKSGDAGGDVEAQQRDGEDPEDGSEAGAGDQVQDDSDGPVEPIDSGADQGLGGIPLPEYGSPEAVEQITTKMHEAHEDVCQTGNKSEDKADEKAIKVAVIQGRYFETPSAHVEEVVEHTGGQGKAWYFKQELDMHDQIALGLEVDCDVPEAILGPSLLKLRRIFSDNKTAHMERHRRSGHVDARVLGKRAWNGDDRLFMKKRVPGKKDYAVVISIDVSSSNLGLNLALVKRAAFAQAELLHRLGVDFAVFAHSADLRGTARDRSFAMDIWRIKDWSQPWNPETQRLLSDISGQGGNLDGHALEYGRKMLDESDATDKILLYYTDGKMPAANKEEELRILQREIRTCKQSRYTLLGVGIRTDSPIRHGLDTVQVDDDDDLPRVVEHLGRRLTGAAR